MYGKHNAEYYFINGEKYEQQLLYPEAILEYLEALRLDTNAIIYYALGRNYLKINKFNRAEEYFKKAINYDSTFTPALEKLGDLYIFTYKDKKAIKTYEELTRINPSIKNLEKLAHLYQFSDLEKAAEIYEKIRLNNNNNKQLLLKLAYIYYKLKDTAKYIQRLEEAYKLSPNDDNIISELIKVYLLNKQNEKAISLFEISKEQLLSNDFHSLLQSVGEFLIRSDDTLYVLFKKKYIASIDSRFYFSWELQTYGGIIASQIHNNSAAEKYYKNAMTYADSIPEISLQLANFYLIHENYPKALNILNDNFKNFPDDNRFLDLIAMTYYQMDSTRQAIPYLKKSLSLDDEDMEAMNQLAIIYDRLGFVDSSDYYYEQVLEISPYNSLANNNYAYSLANRKKDLNRALEMSKKSLEADSTNASYLDTYGWILYQMGKYNEAIYFIKKSSKSSEAQGEVYQHLGDVFLKLNRKDDAIKAWKKGLEIEPDNQELINRLNKNK